MTALAPSLQPYFTDRLIGQRAASPNTIGAYKLTFRLLLTFAARRLGKTPAALDIAELDAPLTRRSSITSNATATTAPPPATTGWPRSTRCSATSPCTTPSTPAPQRVSSPSHPNEPNATC